VTTESLAMKSRKIQEQAHSNCIVCGSTNDRCLGLDFIQLEDGSVQAFFDCEKVYAGYQNLMHGGVIALLLDGAMTNCMFAHGCLAVTAELNVRFRHPVLTGRKAIVRAWIDQSSPPLYVLKAELIQDEQVKATTTGKFMDQPNLATMETAIRGKRRQSHMKGNM